MRGDPNQTPQALGARGKGGEWQTRWPSRRGVGFVGAPGEVKNPQAKEGLGQKKKTKPRRRKGKKSISQATGGGNWVALGRRMNKKACGGAPDMRPVPPWGRNSRVGGGSKNREGRPKCKGENGKEGKEDTNWTTAMDEWVKKVASLGKGTPKVGGAGDSVGGNHNQPKFATPGTNRGRRPSKKRVGQTKQKRPDNCFLGPGGGKGVVPGAHWAT